MMDKLDNPDAGIEPELFSVTQVARLLSVSVRLIWYLTASGQLPAVRLGKRTLWCRADILAFIGRLPRHGDAGSDTA